MPLLCTNLTVGLRAAGCGLRATSAYLFGSSCSLVNSIKTVRGFGPEENFTMR